MNAKGKRPERLLADRKILRDYCGGSSALEGPSMHPTRRKSREEWTEWLERVQRNVLGPLPLYSTLELRFVADADDEAALGRLQKRLERLVFELDQDALDAELLARILDLGNEAPAAKRVQFRLDSLSVSVVGLLLAVKDRRFELSHREPGEH